MTKNRRDPASQQRAKTRTDSKVVLSDLHMCACTNTQAGMYMNMHTNTIINKCKNTDNPMK